MSRCRKHAKTTGCNNLSVEKKSLKNRLSGLYYGWRMIGLVSALRVLGGGLHNYGFTVFFLPVTQELGLTPRLNFFGVFSRPRSGLFFVASRRSSRRSLRSQANDDRGLAARRDRLHTFLLGRQLHHVSDCLSGCNLDFIYRWLRSRAHHRGQQLVYSPARPGNDGGQRSRAGGRRDYHPAPSDRGQPVGMALGRLYIRDAFSGARASIMFRRAAVSREHGHATGRRAASECKESRRRSDATN